MNISSKGENSSNYQNTNGILNTAICIGSGSMDNSSKKLAIGLSASNLQNYLDSLNSFIIPSSEATNIQIDVSNSSNYGSSMYAWGGVRNLTNCISTGGSSYWGAKNSTNCIDAGVQNQGFFYDFSKKEGVATNCVSLVPNESGAYKYYNSASKVAEVKKASLINKDFFVSLLKFDESVWNFDGLNIIQKQYPKIRE